jgi:integrase/recombinase XerC
MLSRPASDFLASFAAAFRGIVVDLRGLAAAPGAARLHLADGVPLLRPDEQVFQAMLDGWRNQQLARNLARSTVEGREATVRDFAGYVSAYPWAWTPAMVDEWLGDLRSLRDLKRPTIRSYSEAVRAFCHFATDPLYGWAETCEERFGTHPVQVDVLAAQRRERARRERPQRWGRPKPKAA